MTLMQVIHLIEKIASAQPSVNMIVRNDIFRLNNKADTRYGVFAWLQGQHTMDIDAACVTYHFTLFYVDRLRADRGNEIEVQSVGMQTLTNILRYVNESGVYVSSLSFQTFNQRFLDECAGVFCNVAIDAPVDDNCPESFADFNDDFNEDFLIY